MPDTVSVVVAGRYELIEPIGRGGMAEVWRGHDRKGDRPVAVKILDPMAGDIAAAERFAREARAAARVVHPNVVTILDVGADEQRRFLVMELLTSHSLAAELTDRGRFDVGDACRLLAQAAAGLAAAHRAGVVHRDVKPANLHLTADGTLKVVDFGLAHLASEAARLTTVGTIIGTPAYLAPEQIDGSGGGPATDLYALGCVAYELLCGQPPFTGSPAELVYQHVHQSPVPPSAHRPDIPTELEQLILAMLAKDPAARPSSAEQVRRVLTAGADTARSQGRHISMPTPGVARAGDTAVLPALEPAQTALPENHRLLLQLAAAIAAIAVVTVAALTLFSNSGQQAASPSPSSAPNNGVPERSPSAASTVTPSPRPTQTSTIPSAQDPRAWLAAFDRTVTAQQRSGGIEPDLANKAHEKIQEAAKKLAEGKSGEAREKIQELGRDLAEAQREGKLADGPLTAFLARAGLSAAEEDD